MVSKIKLILTFFLFQVTNFLNNLEVVTGETGEQETTPDTSVPNSRGQQTSRFLQYS